MSFRAFAVPIFVVASVIAACSGDDGAVTSSSSGGPNSSGTVAPDTDASAGSSSSSGGTVNGIDISSITSFTIGSDSCVRPQGECVDAQSFTVDFTTSVLTSITCVELGAKPDSGTGGTQDGKTSHPITKDQLDTLRKLLGNLKTAGPAVSADAGPATNTLHALQLTSKTQGTSFYVTAETVCPKVQPATSITAGWNELWDAIRTM